MLTQATTNIQFFLEFKMRGWKKSDLSTFYLANGTEAFICLCFKGFCYICIIVQK